VGQKRKALKLTKETLRDLAASARREGALKGGVLTATCPSAVVRLTARCQA
jgi:hypothetical protein